ncbi:MAG: hypothetical protein OEY14_19050, partial [Myxococcales bacterium]|nr:hypothetical protein [Myxococcales bacterium]
RCDRMSDPAVCRDIALPDGALPDAALPDGALPDAALPDGALPDGALPDGGAGAFGLDRIAGGAVHNCVALSTTDLRCWGGNTFGQVGDGSLMSRHGPVPIALPDVQRLAAGSFHTCAQTSTGVFCWGQNAVGELGLPSATLPSSSTPVAIGRTLLGSDIEAGRDHTCVLEAGRLFCWGGNEMGQLMADPALVPARDLPTEILGLSGAPSRIATRGGHVCALYPAGTIQCWGRNWYGQLGDGTQGLTPIFTPRDVLGITDAVEIAAGSNHTCARSAAGDVRCWGDNAYRQVGTGTATAAYLEPSPVVLSGAAELAAGFLHTCARMMDGTVKCWGDNLRSQCGRDGIFEFEVLVPTTVLDGAGVPLSGVQELVAGEQHTCARTATGHVCWGDDRDGQLGDGSVCTLSPCESFLPSAVMLP